jgi:hypothetical protein
MTNPKTETGLVEWMREGLDVKTVFFLLVQLVSLAWYGSSINSRLNALESAKTVSRDEYEVRDKSISDSLADLKASQLRIETKIDAISERK